MDVSYCSELQKYVLKISVKSVDKVSYQKARNDSIINEIQKESVTIDLLDYSERDYFLLLDPGYTYIVENKEREYILHLPGIQTQVQNMQTHFMQTESK